VLFGFSRTVRPRQSSSAPARPIQAAETDGGFDIPDGLLFYCTEVAPLAEAAPDLRCFIAERDVGLIIVDSVGLARGGAPESSEDTLRFFRAALAPA